MHPQDVQCFLRSRRLASTLAKPSYTFRVPQPMSAPGLRAPTIAPVMDTALICLGNVAPEARASMWILSPECRASWASGLLWCCPGREPPRIVRNTFCCTVSSSFSSASCLGLTVSKLLLDASSSGNIKRCECITTRQRVGRITYHVRLVLLSLPPH